MNRLVMFDMHISMRFVHVPFPLCFVFFSVVSGSWLWIRACIAAHIVLEFVLRFLYFPYRFLFLPLGRGNFHVDITAFVCGLELPRLCNQTLFGRAVALMSAATVSAGAMSAGHGFKVPGLWLLGQVVCRSVHSVTCRRHGQLVPILYLSTPGLT